MEAVAPLAGSPRHSGHAQTFDSVLWSYNKMATGTVGCLEIPPIKHVLSCPIGPSTHPARLKRKGNVYTYPHFDSVPLRFRAFRHFFTMGSVSANNNVSHLRFGLLSNVFSSFCKPLCKQRANELIVVPRSKTDS